MTPSNDVVILIKFIQSYPNEIIIETNSNDKQFLVLSEIYYPEGWKVFVNNQESKIYEVNALLRGVELPEGKNIVKFKFSPSDVKLGSILSIISTLIIILFLFSSLFKKNEK